MHRSFFHSLSLVVAFLAGCSASGLVAGPTPFPLGNDDSAWAGQGPIRVHPWMKENRAFFWTQREKDQGAVVFVGSSMMGNWKTLPASFPGLKVANRGIGGDVSRGLLFRLKEDVLDLNPRAVVMSIGSNDLSAHGDPAAVAANVGAIIDLARAHNPALSIIVCQIPPRDDPNAPLKPGARDDLNRRIVALGTDKKVTVVDLAPTLAHADGSLILELYAKDRIHFTAAGYEKIGAVLRAELARLGVQ
jgi:lysophospholipase L1-like esterase